MRQRLYDALLSAATKQAGGAGDEEAHEEADQRATDCTDRIMELLKKEYSAAPPSGAGGAGGGDRTGELRAKWTQLHRAIKDPRNTGLHDRLLSG
eukprot:gene15745-37488_t